MATLSGLILSVLYLFILLSPALQAGKTFKLDLLDESEEYNARRLARRQTGNGWRSTDITYNASSYQFYVEVTVGDNNKNLKLGVIQNPYTWVASRWNSTDPCPPDPDVAPWVCPTVLASGFFNLYPPDSSTYRNLSEDFSILYADNRYVIGNWGRDRFRLGQLTVEDVNFGVGQLYNATPVLGLDRSDSGVKYPTFLEVMAANDIINTPTYGIYAGDIRGKQDSGKSITFGGIDIAKFTRPLRTYSSRTSYALNLLSVDVVSGGEVTATPLDLPVTSPIVADMNFGTPSLHILTDIFDVMMNDIGALPSESYYISSLPPDNSGLNFTFTDGLSIFVPYSQMYTWDPDTSWYSPLVRPNDDSVTLGTPFFRSAYLFYDFENTEFSIAPALYNVSTSNVLEVGINGDSVRQLDLGPQTSEPPQTPGPTTPVATTPVGPPTTTTAPPIATMSGKSTPVAAIAGGTVGGVVLILAIIGVCYYFFSYRPSHRGSTMPQPPIETNHTGGMNMPPVAGPGANNGLGNEQFSPAKPTHISPVASSVGSPMSELSAWGRTENMAVHGFQRNPNIHEMA